MTAMNVGIIGCGAISDVYFAGAARSELIRVKACADLRHDAAEAKAKQYLVEAVSVEAILADPAIELIINLTNPSAHGIVSRQIVDAGKHVYLEKPLATQLQEARSLLRHATERGMRVGCAPDTFFGAAHQASRRVIDAQLIGRPIGGSVAVLSRGMESWHPNPEFFYQSGGGPILDMGPYYLTQLINMLGPVALVSACASIGNPTRTVTSEFRNGQVIQVGVATTVNGTLAFANGANVTLSASWDVWSHKRMPIEIYGTQGSLLVPDPNFFGGMPLLSRRGGSWEEVDISKHPFGAINRTTRTGDQVADYRIVGVIDMAMAIHHQRPHRASGDLALHVLEVLDAFERSSAERRHVTIQSTCIRPEPLPYGIGDEVFH